MTDPSGAYEYTYDARGNLIEEAKTIDGVTYETDYAYDSAGVRNAGYREHRVAKRPFMLSGYTAYARSNTIAFSAILLRIGIAASCAPYGRR